MQLKTKAKLPNMIGIVVNKLLTQKLLKQGYRYHKLRKTFSKFYRRYYDLISKFQVGQFFQFIHQVTREFRFRKYFAQEIFKSSLQFSYQIIVSSIKRKGFAKFMRKGFAKSNY